MGAQELSFEVAGLPPAKAEAKSMLAEGHPHHQRVVRLLEAARDALTQHGHPGFGSARLGLAVVLRTVGDPLSDATNYLGGIGDVLEAKTRRAAYISHLGDLGNVELFDNDSQLREVHYRHEHGDSDSYTLRIWEL